MMIGPIRCLHCQWSQLVAMQFFLLVLGGGAAGFYTFQKQSGAMSAVLCSSLNEEMLSSFINR